MNSSDLQKSLGKEGSRLLLKAVALFNKGKFWESHEVFEDLWRSQEGELKKFAQALVQAAAAFSYIKLKRYQSILYLFDKSAEKLEVTQHLLPELEVGILIVALQRAKAEVERLGEAGLRNFDAVLYPRIEVSISRSHRKTSVRTERTRRIIRR